MSRARFRRRDLDATEASIRSLRKRKVPGVKSISRKRLRAVMRYTREYDLETWEKIARRKDVLSYSLLLRELSELDYLEKQGIDPLNDAERARHFVRAHAEALRTEHEFLMKLAQTRSPKTRFNLGTFVAFNPSVHPRTNQLDVALIQRYWNRQDARTDVGTADVQTFYAVLLNEW